VDYKAHQFQLAKEIFDREEMKSLPWNSERVMDLVSTFLDYWEAQGLKHPELSLWLRKFKDDKPKAAKAFWQEIRRGQEEAFRDGADKIPDQLTPWQQNNTHKK
jgi:ABC-type nitrate/sulfonate/bicarbonate transport system substrate-binding protein